ncbi:MAG: hypothetical protein EAZ64_01885 [Sphingobacteriales bacterium]|nr:MAG: hypothetical protein EAZ64_01885 [Sphingobacteriales bacterium]
MYIPTKALNNNGISLKKYIVKDAYLNQFSIFERKKKIMAKNPSVSIDNYFVNFINDKISFSRFSSANEVVHFALRLL